MHPRPLPSPGMRDLDTIDSELRLIAALRRTAAEMGAPAPRIDVADQLLERVDHRLPSNNLDVWAAHSGDNAVAAV